MKRTVAALMLATAIATPLIPTALVAQEARLSGTVAEVYGTQIVLVTPEGRLLVALPEGAAVPAPGTRLDLTGTRTGETFAATAITPATAPTSDESILPVALRGLGLTEVRTRTDDDGEVYIYARAGQTGWLRAEARGDRLTEVQADGAGLPDALVTAMLPVNARAEARLSEITRLTEIETEDDGAVSVEGYDAAGMRIEVEFARDGSLRSFERERDDRRSLTEVAARDRLAELGYRDVGFVERGGRHVSALATNPYGDMVEVRLDDQGRVERERLWQN